VYAGDTNQEAQKTLREMEMEREKGSENSKPLKNTKGFIKHSPHTQACLPAYIRCGYSE
jgi:hypothetical protein